MSHRLRIPLSLLVLGLGAALVVASCNITHCERLRDELFAQKLKWQACESDLDCMIVGGNTKDCTGILSCALAVNRKYRPEADRRIASLPEETVDCMECQSPDCVDGDIPLCEPVLKQCIVVTRILDGGAPASSLVTPDGGGGSPEPMGAGGSP